MLDRRTVIKVGEITAAGGGILGALVTPVRTHLTKEVTLYNRRDVEMALDFGITANGEEAFTSTFWISPHSFVDVSPRWPLSAWSYEVLFRLTDQNEWSTIERTAAGTVGFTLTIQRKEEVLPSDKRPPFYWGWSV